MVSRPFREWRVASVETHGWPYDDHQVVASETNHPGQTWIVSMAIPRWTETQGFEATISHTVQSLFEVGDGDGVMQ
jgi:hypothetical protein